MLTKEIKVDQVTVTENGIVLYRVATRVLEDGKPLSQTFHRTSLVPGQDLTGQPPNVAAIAQTAWTPDVIAAYRAEQERIAAEMAAQAAAAQQPAAEA